MTQKRWSAKKANDWYARQPWRVGCNFIPSTAINQLEMWQAESFDLPTITRELGWAAGLGFNTARVYLHDLLWSADPNGFKARIDAFLQVSVRYNIFPIFVLFDDCWNQTFSLGKQPEPIPGVHNSGWVQSPGSAKVVDPSTWAPLEAYVTQVIRTFCEDERILAWDLYNEPGNSNQGDKSLPLARAVFEWARAATPARIQPLTMGVWFDNAALNDFQLEASDVISFHNYADAASLEAQIQQLKALKRPLLCTEYMSRKQNSRFETHLPIFKREKVACLNWGLVSGKTQTIYPWGSAQGAAEPDPWFHDIFHKDGRPYDPREVDCIRRLVKGA